MTATIQRPAARKRVCRCDDPTTQKLRGLCRSCYVRARSDGTIETHPRNLRNAEEIIRDFHRYRATTTLTRKEVAAELGMTLPAIDAAMSRYRKRQADAEADAEAREASEAFEFIRSALHKASAVAPPLPTADELAQWHATGCPLGHRLVVVRERAA
jgi:hypothetical protein